MKKMYMRKGILLAAVCCTLSLPMAVHAQTAPKVGDKVNVIFSEDALKTFVEINKKMGASQMKAQQDIVAAMQVVGISQQRFGELFAEESKTGKVSATGEELKKYNMAKDRVSSIQEAFGLQMKKAILAEGMDPVEFQKITMAYTQDSSVKKRVDEILQGN